jgi:hypothetical protein
MFFLPSSVVAASLFAFPAAAAIPFSFILRTVDSPFIHSFDCLLKRISFCVCFD